MIRRAGAECSIVVARRRTVSIGAFIQTACGKWRVVAELLSDPRAGGKPLLPEQRVAVRAAELRMEMPRLSRKRMILAPWPRATPWAPGAPRRTDAYSDIPSCPAGGPVCTPAEPLVGPAGRASRPRLRARRSDTSAPCDRGVRREFAGRGGAEHTRWRFRGSRR